MPKLQRPWTLGRQGTEITRPAWDAVPGAHRECVGSLRGGRNQQGCQLGSLLAWTLILIRGRPAAARM